MASDAPLALTIGRWIEATRSEELPTAVRRASGASVLDTLGLSVAARNTAYVSALCEAWTTPGPCRIYGSDQRLDAVSAAMINGTAAHGEDFDNTFEGCPIHWGAVIVPAVVAVAEAHDLDAAAALKGLAIGGELTCRLGLVAKKGVHAAGFHPTAVLGAMGSAAGVAASLGLTAEQTAHALGIAGSMASGIIEYLADGSWTKRMHAGWAAQSGIRAALMARAGFTGPVTVFEGRHGLMHGFAPTVSPEFDLLGRDLGEHWHAERTAFKPFACGTMTQPFIDCALELASAVPASEIRSLRCSVGEGTVHRLWEPLEQKRRPPNGYAAKFSTPYCVAVAYLRGAAGLAEFTDDAVRASDVLALAERVSYEIDPDDEYPRNYTGRIVATLSDGSEREAFQPYLRGGSREPLPRETLERKCASNVAYAGCPASIATALIAFAEALEEGRAAGPIGTLLDDFFAD